MKKVLKKLFLLFCVLAFIFSCVGCNGEISTPNSETQNSSSSFEDKITGPMVNYINSFSTNGEFKTFVEEYNTLKNKTFITFDFDNLEQIEEKSYVIETIVNSNLVNVQGQIYDYQVDCITVYFFFTSVNHPIGSGIESESFVIECSYSSKVYDIAINKEGVVFKLEGVKDNSIYNYKLIFNQIELMDVVIKVGANCTENTVDNLLQTLKESLIIFK